MFFRDFAPNSSPQKTLEIPDYLARQNNLGGSTHHEYGKETHNVLWNLDVGAEGKSPAAKGQIKEDIFVFGVFAPNARFQIVLERLPKNFRVF